MSERSPLAELARVQDVVLEDSSRVDRVRRRLELSGFEPARAPSPRRKGAYVAAVGFAVAAAAVVGVFLRFEEPITFEVDGVGGEPRAPLVATEHGLELRFSDGSSAVLARGGAATVQSTEEHGAHLELSRGRIDLRIRPRPDTEWSVTAGEVRVVVHGTRFAVERAGTTTSVEVSRGLVEVVPPNAPSVWLHDGESYTYPVPTSSALDSAALDPALDRDDGASTLAASAQESPASAAESPPGRGAEDPSPVRARRGPPAGEPSAVEVRGYETLVRAGLFDEALEQARRRGLDGEIRRLPRTELLALGDAARFAGASTLARRVYVAVRRRFARTHESAMASFAMGRICADRLRRPRCAAENFEAYLHEAPNGPLASDALARLIEARRDGGDLAGARGAARRYLDRYPRGQRRDMAQRTLEP